MEFVIRFYKWQTIICRLWIAIFKHEFENSAKKCIYRFISPFVNGIPTTKLPKYKKCHSECSQCSIHLKYVYIIGWLHFPTKNLRYCLKSWKFLSPIFVKWNICRIWSFQKKKCNHPNVQCIHGYGDWNCVETRDH